MARRLRVRAITGSERFIDALPPSTAPAARALAGATTIATAARRDRRSCCDRAPSRSDRRRHGRRRGRRAATSTPPPRGPSTTATRWARAPTPRASPSSAGDPAWTSPVLDGQVYGEPLEATGRVFVATENDTVYALAADTGAVLVVHPRRDPGAVGRPPLRRHQPVGRHHRHPGRGRRPGRDLRRRRRAGGRRARPLSSRASTCTAGPSTSTWPWTRPDRTKPPSCNAPV